jgi:hypothetical protein
MWDPFHPAPLASEWPGATRLPLRVKREPFVQIVRQRADGSNRKTLAYAEGNPTGIAYVELPAGH